MHTHFVFECGFISEFVFVSNCGYSKINIHKITKYYTQDALVINRAEHILIKIYKTLCETHLGLGPSDNFSEEDSLNMLN